MRPVRWNDSSPPPASAAKRDACPRRMPWAIASARPSSFNPDGCGRILDYPHSLVWHSWTSKQAIATGTVSVLVGDPDCASGTDKDFAASVRLWGDTKANGVEYFTYVTYTSSKSSEQGTDTEPLFILCKYSKPPCDPEWPPPHK